MADMQEDYVYWIVHAFLSRYPHDVSDAAEELAVQLVKDSDPKLTTNLAKFVDMARLTLGE